MIQSRSCSNKASSSASVVNKVSQQKCSSKTFVLWSEWGRVEMTSWRWLTGSWILRVSKQIELTQFWRLKGKHSCGDVIYDRLYNKTFSRHQQFSPKKLFRLKWTFANDNLMNSFLDGDQKIAINIAAEAKEKWFLLRAQTSFLSKISRIRFHSNKHALLTIFLNIIFLYRRHDRTRKTKLFFGSQSCFVGKIENDLDSRKLFVEINFLRQSNSLCWCRL